MLFQKKSLQQTMQIQVIINVKYKIKTCLFKQP